MKIDKLYVHTTEAALWHLYDKEVKHSDFKSRAWIVFAVLLPFVYLPFAISGAVWSYALDPKVVGFCVLIPTATAAFLNVCLLSTERYNVYLAKYLKRPDASLDVKLTLAEDFTPLKLLLYNQNYTFMNAYIEDGHLVMNFQDHGMPIQLRGLYYTRHYTSDADQQNTIILTDQGIEIYLPIPEPQGRTLLPVGEVIL